MILQTVPVLPALNLEETILFYESKLGFRAFNHGDYVTMEKDGSRLHFFLCRDKYICENSGCYIYVTNIEDFYVKLSALNIIHPNGKLSSKTWGMREFCILDNNGNLIRFGEDSNP
jgi:catechol 2,3-dioxygenase-like lactoylglutathione lyase family enzyme